MNDLRLLKKIASFDKPVFSVDDLKKILAVGKKSINTVIARLKAREVIYPVSRGWYCPSDRLITAEEAAVVIYPPCYLSLAAVLSKAGVINQIPRQIDCVTTRKTYRTMILNVRVIYHQIRPKLFFGFYVDNNLIQAYPEKALLDLYYFSKKGKETINRQEMDLSLLNSSRLKKFEKMFKG